MVFPGSTRSSRRCWMISTLGRETVRLISRPPMRTCTRPSRRILGWQGSSD
jgi:hypothetical protein